MSLLERIKTHTSLVFFIILFAIIFAVLSAIIHFIWAPFASADTNTVWQMFLNVLYGALLTAVLTITVFLVQSNLQKKDEEENRKRLQENEEKNRNLLHKQEIARSYKIELYNEMLNFAATALHKKETIEDIKKIESYLYKLVAYADDKVVNKALAMFSSAIDTHTGGPRDTVIEFADACNKDLYGYDSGLLLNSGIPEAEQENKKPEEKKNTLEEIGKRIRSFQATVLNLGKAPTAIKFITLSSLDMDSRYSIPDHLWDTVRTSYQLGVGFTSSHTEQQGFDVFDTEKGFMVCIERKDNGLSLGEAKNKKREFKKGDVLVFLVAPRAQKLQSGIAGIARVESATTVSWLASTSIRRMEFIEDEKELKTIKDHYCEPRADFSDELLAIYSNALSSLKEKLQRDANEKRTIKATKQYTYLLIDPSDRNVYADHIAKCATYESFALNINSSYDIFNFTALWSAMSKDKYKFALAPKVSEEEYGKVLTDHLKDILLPSSDPARYVLSFSYADSERPLISITTG